MIETENDNPMLLKVGSGTQKGVNTELTTVEGLQAAFDWVCAEWPERPRYEHEIILNIAASDWQNGHEASVEKLLVREYGLMAHFRIIAYLVATPGRKRTDSSHVPE